MTSKTKTVIIWALYAASIAAILTTFIGIALAYVWRRGDPGSRAVYDKQIRRFWTAGMGWAVGIAVIVLAAITDTAPAGSGMPLLGNIGLLIVIATQIWFCISSIISLITTSLSSDDGQQPKQYA